MRASGKRTRNVARHDHNAASNTTTDTDQDLQYARNAANKVRKIFTLKNEQKDAIHNLQRKKAAA